MRGMGRRLNSKEEADIETVSIFFKLQLFFIHSLVSFFR